MAAALDQLNLAVLSEGLDALTQLVEDRIFPAAQFFHVDFRRAKLDAAQGGISRLAENLCGVKQRLRRNAADV